MKFVKALNQGIVTDLGIGKQQYSISLEGIEVADDVAAKIKEIFGYLVEVTDVAEVPVQEEKAEEKIEENVDEVKTSSPSANVEENSDTTSPTNTNSDQNLGEGEQA